MKTFEEHVHSEIKRILLQKKSFHRKDYHLKTYDDFGEYYPRPQLEGDLLQHLGENLTFWAVFKDVEALSEDEFELKMQKELSSLSLLQTQGSNDDFCFSFGEKSFFVMGLHPKSSRPSRRFPWPALVFNSFEPAQSRRINPMVLLYSERWQSIQA